MAQLDVQEALRGARILFTGATGFLGKVTLSQLLHHYGDAVGQVFVLVRKGSSKSSEQRFLDKVVGAEPFRPLREARGEEGLAALVREKVRVVDGDIAQRWLGLGEDSVRALSGGVDVVVNCAGLVSFTPPLEVALNVNTHGALNLVELCRTWGVPLVHVSTAFVAGNRSGLVFEDEPVLGTFPRREELQHEDFTVDNELADCSRTVARLREEADDHAHLSNFRTRALERLDAEGRDAGDPKTLRLAIARERKLWLTGELVRAGMDRAKHWGWPNTYTYAKALGEQAIAAAPELSYAIVRPSIVESAERYPFPGWNEGFTTSAPLAFEGLKNPAGIPAGKNIILDLIPVDHVSSAIVAVTARILKEKDRRVFHLASGDLNPFHASRTVELVGLYRRRHFRNKDGGNAWVRNVKSRLEPRALEKRAFELFSTPMFTRGAKALSQALEEATPRWGAPNLTAAAAHARRALDHASGRIESFHNLSELFRPFLLENRYVFRCDHVRELMGSLSAEDRERLHCAPESIDWRTYFLEVHLPGLERWVFPGLEEERTRRRSVQTYRDLLELLEGTTHAFRHRVAFRMLDGDREERFTFGQFHHWVQRVASHLAHAGLQPEDRVVLLSENRPEWGMAYFGILKAAGVAVPVDRQLSLEELINILRRSGASHLLLSEQVLEEHEGLHARLTEAGLEVRVLTLAEAMAGDPTAPNGVAELKRAVRPDTLASIIFTSGTTGTPKGVMLTHRNFAALVARLSATFELGEGDGLLSVLPLHHTFEFACGFLTPFNLGAEVTYIDELTSDRLGEVLESGRISAMIGVPALFQLLHRRITQEMASGPRLVEEALHGLMKLNGELRGRSEVNLGKLLFWPVHRKLAAVRSTWASSSSGRCTASSADA